MKFTKMQGIGNDYVYVDGTKEVVDNHTELAIRLSNRNFGIGSDGLIFINKSDVADFEMEMYNADGSRSEMCGNGIRCVGKFVYDHGLTDKEEITVETLAGIKVLKFRIEDGKVKTVEVDMGEPIFKTKDVPVVSENEEAIMEDILVDGKTYQMTCISMGNPHSVVFIEEDVKDFPLEVVGPKFESHERFPRRVNAEFVKVLNRNEIDMRVWERGSGETMACGTGACAVAVAAIRNGFTEDKVTIHLLGGDLQIYWNRESNRVFMTGPAEISFEGEIAL